VHQHDGDRANAIVPGRPQIALGARQVERRHELAMRADSLVGPRSRVRTVASAVRSCARRASAGSGSRCAARRQIHA
jgi:hypothetical protein